MPRASCCSLQIVAMALAEPPATLGALWWAITQQNAALLEELAASAQSVQGQVEAVRNAMCLSRICRMFHLERGELSLSQIDAVALRKEACSVAHEEPQVEDAQPGQAPARMRTRALAA